jgi:hypothetical protein
MFLEPTLAFRHAGSHLYIVSGLMPDTVETVLKRMRFAVK